MTEDVVDKDKYKAAVFRRGSKQELFHEDDGLKEVTGDEKLDDLLKIWSLPRSGYVCFSSLVWSLCMSCVFRLGVTYAPIHGH
jgi:hypothetical protein